MSNLTLANQLTILRIVLVPAFVLLVVYGRLGAALLVFLVAGITDALDGLIARLAGPAHQPRRLARSDGRQAAARHDVHRADAAGVPLTNHLPLWLTVLVISRDVVIVAFVAIVNLAIGPRTFTPSLLGKSATAAFIVTSVVMMYFNYLRADVLAGRRRYLVVAGAHVASSADYFFRVRRLVNER